MDYILEHLSELLHIDIICLEEGRLKAAHADMEQHPIYCSPVLRAHLLEESGKRKIPYVWKDAFQVYWGCIHEAGQYYIVGPMNPCITGRVELHRFYREYGVPKEYEKTLRRLTFTEILLMVETVAKSVTGKKYTHQELIEANQLSRGDEEDLLPPLYLEPDEEELYHHTYQEERSILESIREGRAEDAVKQTDRMDAYLGRMSSTEIAHWHNALVVAVTLGTRAAIEGGVPPWEAYRISDYYLQKGNGCDDIAQLLFFRKQALTELAKRVRDRREGQIVSGYTERCKDYVQKHFREKIYTEDIAQALGISTGYLSRLFKKETGICLQDYINEVRVERAANLLRYSRESISAIAEYVHFPSQSYFGSIFKKYKKMTPRQYRETYKPAEFE